MPRKIHTALLDGDSHESSLEWLAKMSQEPTKEKGTTCLIYFHTGVRRTELLLLLHPRAPSLLWSLFFYCSSFPGETNTGEPWEESQAHHSFPQHHSCFQPCPQPSLTGCIKVKLSATLSRPWQHLNVCRASSDHGDITHAHLCLSPVPPPVFPALWLFSFIPPQAYQLCCHCGLDLYSSPFHAMTQTNFLFSHLQIFSTLESKIFWLITEGL